MITELAIPESRQKPMPGCYIDRTHPLAQGLVSSWLLNEGGGTSAYDLSGYGNYGTLTNKVPGTDWIVEAQGKALFFLNGGGSNDYVNVSGTALNTSYGSIVAGARSYTTGVALGAYSATILNRQNTNAGTFALFLNPGTDGMRGRVRREGAEGSPNNVEADSTLDTNYHNYAMTFDGVMLRLYIDGLEQSTPTAAAGPIDQDNYTAAYVGNNPGNGTTCWDGSISYVYYYDRALTANEVHDIHIAPFSFIRQPGFDRARVVIAAPAAGIPIFRRRIEAA